MVESIAVAMTANLALMACISSTMAGRAAMRVFMVSISWCICGTAAMSFAVFELWTPPKHGYSTQPDFPPVTLEAVTP